MPDWINIIILGIIEGITEFLPISSTGHLLIAERLMVAWHWMAHQQSDTFNVVIQAGAVLAVIPLFKNRFHQFIFQWREPATQNYLMKILVAFVITGMGGLIIENPHKILHKLVVIFKITGPRQKAIENMTFKLPEHIAPWRGLC